jgi:hypothetical protein
VKRNKQTDAKEWQESYTQVVQCPYSWLSTATELLHAANMVLEKETEGPMQGFYVNIGIHMMLTSLRGSKRYSRALESTSIFGIGVFVTPAMGNP